MKYNEAIVKIHTWRLKNISDTNFILLVGVITGACAGLAAVILKSVVHVIHDLLEENMDLTGINFIYLFYPLVGILITVLLAKYYFKESLGHGITNVLYSISKNSSVLRRTWMYSRMVTSAVTVGFGGSVGLEAPIVMTGSAIGSNLARFLHLNYKRRSLMIGCGSAGAIAAIFNSPVAGVIFAIEVILTDITINQFIPILIAAVTGSVISLVLLGEGVMFHFHTIEPFAAKDVPFFIILGLICGLVSLYFTRVTYFVERRLSRIKQEFKRAFVGGVSLALIILIFPPIYGEGYESIIHLLNGDTARILERSLFFNWSHHLVLLAAFVFAVILVKPFAASLTIGAGGSGGIFAPSLFIGGFTGFFIALILNNIFPFAQVNQTQFTLVGMCGVMSGILHAPLTAIFLIAEITDGYTLFVPLMLVSALSYTTMHYFEKYSIYTKRLIEKGDLIQYDKDLQVLSLMNLSSLIEKDLKKISPDSSLGDLTDLIKISKRNIFPVVNEKGGLEGIVTLDDIREIMFDEESRQRIVVRNIMSKPPAQVGTDEKMQSVMNKFEVTQAWNLPVIDNEQYIGFVSKSRIFNAYRQKLIRQTKE